MQLAGWGYVYDKGTGELVSECTVVSDALPANLALYERPTRANPDTEAWDPATRKHVAVTPATKIAALNAQRATLAASITAMGGIPT